jgi:hypothetical protein
VIWTDLTPFIPPSVSGGKQIYQCLVVHGFHDFFCCPITVFLFLGISPLEPMASSTTQVFKWKIVALSIRCVMFLIQWIFVDNLLNIVLVLFPDFLTFTYSYRFYFSWYFSAWATGEPHHLKLQVSDVALYIWSVMFVVQSFCIVENLLNVVLVLFPDIFKTFTYISCGTNEIGWGGGLYSTGSG